jgi:hypothetical protein
MQGVASPGLTVFVLYLSQDENLGVVHNGVEAVGDGDDRAVGELLLDRILKEKKLIKIFHRPEDQFTMATFDDVYENYGKRLKILR